MPYYLIIALSASNFFFYPNYSFDGAIVRAIDALALISLVYSFINFKYSVNRLAELYTHQSLFTTILTFSILSFLLSTFFSDFFVLKKVIQYFENLWLIIFFYMYFNEFKIDSFFVSLFLILLFILFFSFFFQYLPSVGDVYIGRLVRISGLSYVYLGTHLLSVSIFLIAYYLKEKNDKLALIACAVSSSAIILLQVRTIWILYIIVLFLSIYLGYEMSYLKKIFRLFFLTISIFLFINSLSYFFDKPDRYSTLNSWSFSLLSRKLDTFYIRIGLWKAAANIFIDKPLLGKGPGTYGKSYLNYSEPGFKKICEDFNISEVIDAHSQFFTRLSEFGALGVLSHFFLQIFLILRSFTMYLSDKSWYSKGFLVFFITAFFSDLISDALGFKFLYIITGIFLSLTDKYVSDKYGNGK